MDYLTLKPLLFIFGGLAISGFIWLIWYLFGSDPKPRELLSFHKLTAVPAGIVGFILKERFAATDIVATIFDLGRKGVLKIKEAKCKTHADPISEFSGEGHTIAQLDSDLEFHLSLNQQHKKSDLLKHEALLLECLFPLGATNLVLAGRFDKIKERARELSETAWRDAISFELFSGRPTMIIIFWRVFGLILMILGALIVSYEVAIEPDLAPAIIFVFTGAALLGYPAGRIVRDFKEMRIDANFENIIFLIPTFILGVLISIVGFVYYFMQSGPVFDAGSLVLAAGVILATLAEIMPRKSLYGSELLASAKHFKEKGFGAEAHFSQTLPFALALSCMPKTMQDIENTKALKCEYYEPWWENAVGNREISKQANTPFSPRIFADNYDNTRKELERVMGVL